LVPDATMRDVYEWEYRLLRALVEDQSPAASPPPAAPAAQPPGASPSRP